MTKTWMINTWCNRLFFLSRVQLGRSCSSEKGYRPVFPYRAFGFGAPRESISNLSVVVISPRMMPLLHSLFCCVLNRLASSFPSFLSSSCMLTSPDNVILIHRRALALLSTRRM